MTTRCLAAILSADVVGFSKLMGQDEEGTLARIRALRRDVIEPKVQEHHGRLVKTTGDGFLVEFASPVEAVRCAVGMQAALTSPESTPGRHEALQMRIGINLGDIIVEPAGDIYGDGVNVAVRLEKVADAGGICVSGKIYEEVRDKVAASFEDRGEQQVKNIARAVRVYALAPPGAARSEASKPLPLPDKPSIAVLPFTNLSGDPEQEYFADGVVEDIITALSQFKSLFVIARNSSFTYKGRPVDIKQVGRELGVRYVLEGSIRKSGDRIRITSQLNDAVVGVHLWADRLDRSLDDIFALQDEVTMKVVGAIAPTVQFAEIERARHKAPENLDAYDWYLRGVAAFYRTTKESVEDALRLFDAAISLDESFGPAYAFACQCYCFRKAQHWVEDRQKDVADTYRYVRRALDFGSADALCLCQAGYALASVVRDLDAGAAYVSRSVSLNQNLANGWVANGWIDVWRGSADTAIKHFSRARRLSPVDQLRFLIENGTAHAHYHAGRYDEAAVWAEKGFREFRGQLAVSRIAAASYAMAGRPEEARRALEHLRELDPDLRVSTLRQVLGPYRPEGIARYEEGLRRAGLPE